MERIARDGKRIGAKLTLGQRPAARGGLRGGSREVVLGNTRLLVGGDIIVEIDSVPIDGNAALREFLETRTRVGQEVVVKFYRSDEPRTTRVTLGERRQ